MLCMGAASSLFGSPANREGPVALRRRLASGLPLSLVMRPVGRHLSALGADDRRLGPPGLGGDRSGPITRASHPVRPMPDRSCDCDGRHIMIGPPQPVLRRPSGARPVYDEGARAGRPSSEAGDRRGATRHGTAAVVSKGPERRALGSAGVGQCRGGAWRRSRAMGRLEFRSVARLTSWVPWLCVPGSRQVCRFV